MERWVTISISGLKGIGSELTPGFVCFVHWWPTLFSLFLFCSRCLFICQRLCVNMSIRIKHIVCIYCLLALLVRTIIFIPCLPPAFLKLGMQNELRVCFLGDLERVSGIERACNESWCKRNASAQFGSTKKSLRIRDWSCKLKALEVVFQYLDGFCSIVLFSLNESLWCYRGLFV